MVVPPVIFALMLAHLGLSLGLLLFLLWLVAIGLAGLPVALFMGDWLLRQTTRRAPSPYLALLVGLTTLAFLMMIPLFDVVVGGLVIMFGLGSIRPRREGRAGRTPPPPDGLSLRLGAPPTLLTCLSLGLSARGPEAPSENLPAPRSDRRGFALEPAKSAGKSVSRLRVGHTGTHEIHLGATIMTRTAAVFVLLLLLLIPGLALASAMVPIVVPRAINPPSLNGRLEDWPARPLLSLADASYWNSPSVGYGGPEDLSAEVRLTWDNANLYVAVKRAMISSCASLPPKR